MYIRVQSFQIYWNTETGTKTATKLMYTRLYTYTELLSCCVRAVGGGGTLSHTHLSQPMGVGGTFSHTPLPTHGRERDPLTHTSPNPWEWEGPSHTPLPTHGRGSFHRSPAGQLLDLSHLNTLQDNHRDSALDHT